MLIGIDENHPTSGVDPCSRVLVFVSPWCKDFYLTFLLQCNAMQCGGLQGFNLLCVRMYRPHRDRRLSCGGTGSRRVAAWLGCWVGPPRGIHCLFCCLYRCVGCDWGIGRAFLSISIHFQLSLLLLLVLALFPLEQLGMPRVVSEQPTAESGHDRAEQS